jgi:hypothetical protein
VFGSDSEIYVMFYVDDILVHSQMFEEHFDTVISRLTQAGFTLNATKCHFCLSKVKFLGHCISKTGVLADPDRIEAILNYLAPWKCKQLRQFLGMCNFHSCFIVGYADYVDPLLQLLRQGTKWEWTGEKQEASFRLYDSFAPSIT